VLLIYTEKSGKSNGSDRWKISDIPDGEKREPTRDGPDANTDLE